MNVQIGHNSENMDPFEANSTHLADLYEEATQWLDGEPVTTDEQAEALAVLDDNIMAVAKALDDERTKLVAPLNKEKTDIQNKYNPFIQKDKGKADLARSAIKKALAPFMAEKKRKIQEAEEQARLKAEALERAAQEALQNRNASNLNEVAEAEALVEQANAAQKAADKLSKETAAVKGDGRAKSIITTYDPILEDVKLAGEWAWKKHPERFHELILTIAKEQFKMGNRSIAGIGVQEIHSVRG